MNLTQWFWSCRQWTPTGLGRKVHLKNNLLNQFFNIEYQHETIYISSQNSHRIVFILMGYKKLNVLKTAYKINLLSDSIAIDASIMFS